MIGDALRHPMRKGGEKDVGDAHRSIANDYYWPTSREIWRRPLGAPKAIVNAIGLQAAHHLDRLVPATRVQMHRHQRGLVDALLGQRVIDPHAKIPEVGRCSARIPRIIRSSSRLCCLDCAVKRGPVGFYDSH